jgi:TackOD1 domain-containing protein/PilZ domain-containing protein
MTRPATQPTPAPSANEPNRPARDEVLFCSHLAGSFLDISLESSRASGSPSSAAVQERRGAPRYDAARPAVAIPILTDGQPGEPVVATTIDISRTGAAIFVEGPIRPVEERLILGIERTDGVYGYTTAIVRHARSQAMGCLAGVAFASGKDEFFSAMRIMPRFDPATFQLAPVLSEVVLHQWTLAGVLRPYLIDRVKSCPRCGALPTFRDGCPQCGSVRTSAVQFIHHFACAHVTAAIEFDREGCLACPKCRARNLIVGADFEYLTGPLRCLDCSWSGAQHASIAECLKCGSRFLGSEALERDVIQFHVERLDPLAIVETAG